MTQFTPAYAEIEATYLVPTGSPLKTIAEINSTGVRVAVTARTAYGLWLDRNIKHAELIRSETLDSAYDQFVSGKLSALAGLRPRLLSDLEKLPGARILDGRLFLGVGRTEVVLGTGCNESRSLFRPCPLSRSSTTSQILGTPRRNESRASLA